LVYEEVDTELSSDLIEEILDYLSIITRLFQELKEELDAKKEKF